MQFGSVDDCSGGDAAGFDLGDAAGRSGGRSRSGVRFLAARPLFEVVEADGEDFDPFGDLELGHDRVVPGEMEVMAAAVAGVAVIADPAEGSRRTFLQRLGPAGEAGDPGPRA